MENTTPETITSETENTAPIGSGENENTVTASSEDTTPVASDEPVTVVTKKKRTSKSWYVKVKDKDKNEREERINGVTTGEAAQALVTLNEGDEIIGVRPVRAFK